MTSLWANWSQAKGTSPVHTAVIAWQVSDIFASNHVVLESSEPGHSLTLSFCRAKMSIASQQVSTKKVAAIYDPLGNAAHTALEFDLVGEDVLVTGAGPIGLMVTAIARHVGARHVVTTDINPERLQLAKKMGATLAVNATQVEMKSVMQQLGMQEGFDIGFEMSGNADALRQMLGCLNHGAKVSLLGIFNQPVSVDWNEIILKGITMRGIFGRKMFDTWYKVTSMLQSGLDIAQVITHRYPRQEFRTAFEQMRSGKSGKVIIDWS